jgi:hypothetical protein
LAKPPATNDVFLREVDDELRRDELLAAWRRWGRVLIGAVVLGLALFAGWLVWRAHADKAAGVEAEQLQQVSDEIAAGQTAQARATLATLAGSGRQGVRSLARLAEGDDLIAHQNVKGAVAQYAAVAGDAAAGQPLRDLALIKQTAAEYDTLPPQAVIDRLRALAAPGNPWLGSAGEMVGVAYWRLGRREQAARLFDQIAQADDTPASLRQRAVQLAGQMSATTAAPAIGVRPQP